MTIVLIMNVMMVGAINGQVFKIVRKRGAKKAELTFTLGMHRHHITHHTTPYTIFGFIEHTPLNTLYGLIRHTPCDTAYHAHLIYYAQHDAPSSIIHMYVGSNLYSIESYCMSCLSMPSSPFLYPFCSCTHAFPALLHINHYYG